MMDAEKLAMAAFTKAEAAGDAASAADKIYIVEMNSTTYSEAKAAADAGKLLVLHIPAATFLFPNSYILAFQASSNYFAWTTAGVQEENGKPLGIAIGVTLHSSYGWLTTLGTFEVSN